MTENFDEIISNKFFVKIVLTNNAMVLLRKKSKFNFNLIEFVYLSIKHLHYFGYEWKKHL